MAIAALAAVAMIGMGAMIAMGACGTACSRETGEQPSPIGPATKDYGDAGDAPPSKSAPPPPTAAPTTTTNPAAAEALFQEAKKLMTDGKYAEACPKLEASHRLDPADGTLLNLAVCYEHLGDATKACATYAAALESLRAKTPVNAARETFVLDHMASAKCSGVSPAVAGGAPAG